MVHCLFSVKHSEGLSHVGSTKEVQETFPCLTGITNVLRSNLLCATFRIFTLPFQFSFEYAFLHYTEVVCLDRKRLRTFKYFVLLPSLLLPVTTGKHRLSWGRAVWYHQSDQMEKKNYMYPILLRRPV